MTRPLRVRRETSARSSRIQERLSFPDRGARPAFLDWSREQKDAAGVAVLRKALRLLKSGWSPNSPFVDPLFAPERTGWDIKSAVHASSSEVSNIDAVWAVELLRRVEFHYWRWECAASRTKAEVLWFVEKAITLAGGTAPEAARVRRGGWRIGSGS